MNDVTTVDTSNVTAADKAKLWAAILLVAGGIFAFYWLRGDQADWVRWVVFAGALLLGALIIFFSEYGRALGKFVGEARIELYKVFWPTRDETTRMTLVVFGFVILMSVFFWLLDTGLTWATKFLSVKGS
jgi:preprotein translocase subunit SecE